MPKKLNFTLNASELNELAAGIKKDKRPEVKQRAIGLRMLHEGESPAKVANTMAVSQPTVYSWHHRWREKGLEGLANRPKGHRSRLADANYVTLLEKVIDQDPQELGYSFTLWTAARLRAHLEKETEISLKATQFRALLHENGFVYRRPKHDLTNLQDEQARETASDWLDELKKKPKSVRSTFSLWMKAL